MWLFMRTHRTPNSVLPGKGPSADTQKVTLRQVALPERGRVRVVGESHYQDALRLAAGGRAAGDEFEEHIAVTVALVPEPENPWDGNAVRVDVAVGSLMRTVGYLPGDIAPEYQPELLALRGMGIAGTCAGRIAGGGRKSYGIYLHLASPRDIRVARGAEDAVVAESGDGVVLLRNDWFCTLTREEHHQFVLIRYAPSGPNQARDVIASLGMCVVGTGKYRGSEAIEVRIDGHRVGELTHAMTERYRPIVAPLLARGVLVTCEATTTMTAKGVQVELRMPVNPQLLPSRMAV